MNINIDDKKSDYIINKYFSNKKNEDSNIKLYKNYSKIYGSSEKPNSNRKNKQMSFVSKMYNKEKKINISINRSTINKRPSSKQYY